MKSKSTKQRITERQQRNRELAAKDAANRCAYCKRQLPAEGVRMRLGEPDKFCGDGCLLAAGEWEADQ